eukprot:12214226-Heterocapsa_arctica.AAC.1
MRKRGPSANRRVGMIATQSERVRKTSVTRRNESGVPRGRPDPTTESADASLDRQLSEQASEQANRPHSNPVTTQPRLHRVIADLPVIDSTSSMP